MMWMERGEVDTGNPLKGVQDSAYGGLDNDSSHADSEVDGFKMYFKGRNDRTRRYVGYAE